MAKEKEDCKYGEETVQLGIRVPKSREKEFKTVINRLLDEYQYEYLKNKIKQWKIN